MRVPAADRVDRRFWLIDRDGERHFPIRVPRKGDSSDCRFRVSNAGNTLADGLEVEKIEEVQTLVVSEGYSVRAVPESDLSKPPSLLKLNARKILSWGSEDGGGQSLESYWVALAKVVGEPDAGWSRTTKGWVRPKQRNGVYLSIAMNGQGGWVRIGAGIIGDRAGETYKALLARRAAVEKAVGEPLVWDAKEGREKRQVFIKLMCDPNDRSDWPRQHAWVAQRIPLCEQMMEFAQ